jgi:hypothetical protein
MVAKSSSETSADFQRTTRRYITVDRTLRINTSCESHYRKRAAAVAIADPDWFISHHVTILPTVQLTACCPSCLNRIRDELNVSFNSDNNHNRRFHFRTSRSAIMFLGKEFEHPWTLELTLVCVCVCVCVMDITSSQSPQKLKHNFSYLTEIIRNRRNWLVREQNTIILNRSQ